MHFLGAGLHSPVVAPEDQHPRVITLDEDHRLSAGGRAPNGRAKAKAAAKAATAKAKAKPKAKAKAKAAGPSA